MANTVEIGQKPPNLLVKLIKDAPLVSTLIYKNAAGVEIDWPAAPTLQLGASSFTATVTGSVAELTITPAQIDAIASGDKRAVLKVSGQVLGLGVWKLQ